jgi:hypothetical protein
VISQNLNYVLNLRRIHTGLGMHGILMLMIWTCLVPGLLTFLVLMICLFFLLKLLPIVPKLDEANHGATLVGYLSGGTLHKSISSPSVARVNERTSPVNKKTLIDDAPGPSSAPPRGRGCDKGSARKKGHIDFGDRYGLK